MKINIITIMTGSFLIFSACHNSQKATVQEQPKPAPTEVSNAQPVTSASALSSTDALPSGSEISSEDSKTANVQKENNYRLIISFISIGEGTDYKTKEKLDAFIADWQTKNGKQLLTESVPWGREGEVDMCFRLKELNSKEQVEFIKEIKNVVKDSKLVQLSENQACMHMR